METGRDFPLWVAWVIYKASMEWSLVAIPPGLPPPRQRRGGPSEVTAAASGNNSASMRCLLGFGRLFVGSCRTPGPRWPAQRHLLHAEERKNWHGTQYCKCVREISWWLASGIAQEPISFRSRTDLGRQWVGEQASEPRSLQRFDLLLGWAPLLLGAALGAWVQ
jgi:hypothetical protein